MPLEKSLLKDFKTPWIFLQLKFGKMVRFHDPYLHSKYRVQIEPLLMPFFVHLYSSSQGVKRVPKSENSIRPHRSPTPEGFGTTKYCSLIQIVFEIQPLKLKNCRTFLDIKPVD